LTNFSENEKITQIVFEITVDEKKETIISIPTGVEYYEYLLVKNIGVYKDILDDVTLNIDDKIYEPIAFTFLLIIVT
jgi:hypothetical protein